MPIAVANLLHNWSLPSLIEYYNLVSHITYVACVNFIREWRGPTISSRLKFLRNSNIC